MSYDKYQEQFYDNHCNHNDQSSRLKSSHFPGEGAQQGT